MITLESYLPYRRLDPTIRGDHGHCLEAGVHRLDQYVRRFRRAGSTRGFYDSGIHEDAIPDDAVEIPPDLHRTLLDGQSEGKLIMPPDGGHPLPYPADPPAPAPEELAALDAEAAALRAELVAL